MPTNEDLGPDLNALLTKIQSDVQALNERLQQTSSFQAEAKTRQEEYAKLQTSWEKLKNEVDQKLQTSTSELTRLANQADTKLAGMTGLSSGFVSKAGELEILLKADKEERVKWSAEVSVMREEVKQVVGLRHWVRATPIIATCALGVFALAFWVLLRYERIAIASKIDRFEAQFGRVEDALEDHSNFDDLKTYLVSSNELQAGMDTLKLRSMVPCCPPSKPARKGLPCHCTTSSRSGLEKGSEHKCTKRADTTVTKVQTGSFP